MNCQGLFEIIRDCLFNLFKGKVGEVSHEVTERGVKGLIQMGLYQLAMEHWIHETVKPGTLQILGPEKLPPKCNGMTHSRVFSMGS